MPQTYDVPDYIEAEIVDVEYQVMGKKTTICLLTLESGFEIVGTSACVDPAGFEAETGRKWAWKDAIDHLEELDGYARQQALHRSLAVMEPPEI